MPIRPELRDLYPRDWAAISRHVRFVVAGGRCQQCTRPHMVELRCLPDGRWFDEQTKTWCDGRGRQAPWPTLIDVTQLRWTRPVLAAAHLDGDPRNGRRRNLRALCQRCHLRHDRKRHARQRWITYRRRYARGDLFLGDYEGLVCEQRLELSAGLPLRVAAATVRAGGPHGQHAPHTLRGLDARLQRQAGLRWKAGVDQHPLLAALEVERQ